MRDALIREDALGGGGASKSEALPHANSSSLNESRDIALAIEVRLDGGFELDPALATPEVIDIRRNGRYGGLRMSISGKDGGWGDGERVPGDGEA